MTSTLISAAYRTQNDALHEQRPDYGAGGGRWAGMVATIAHVRGCSSILDYGCGKGGLKADLGDIVAEYDVAPGLGKDAPPEPADLVVCTDVLEHIEPEYLDNVLDHLAALSRKALFVNIACRPAKKPLPDGRNAHLIVESPACWIQRLQEKFRIKSVMADGRSIAALLTAKSMSDTTRAST